MTTRFKEVPFNQHPFFAVASPDAQLLLSGPGASPYLLPGKTMAYIYPAGAPLNRSQNPMDVTII
jgi:hypothetical protein